MGENIDRLRMAGIIEKNAAVPTEYEIVIECLSEEELRVLESVKTRLDKARLIGGKKSTGKNFIVI